MEVTLQRLTRVLTKTDIRKLLSATGDGSCGWSQNIFGFKRMERDDLPLPSDEMKLL